MHRQLTQSVSREQSPHSKQSSATDAWSEYKETELPGLNKLMERVTRTYQKGAVLGR